MKRILLILMSVVLVLPMLFTGTALAQEGGDDITLAIGTDPENIDPVEATSSPAAMVMEHIYDTLFHYSEDGEIVPHLAKDYEVSDDGTTWHLHLREDVEFHDGTKFDAEAVKFNLQRLEDATYGFLISEITDIEVVDDYTVKLETDEPFAPLLSHLSHTFISMVSPKAVEEYGDDYNNNPVGTGPFEFKNWVRGEALTVVKNEDYWGEEPKPDKVSFMIVPEDSTRVVLLETGEADAVMRVPPQDIERVEDNENTAIANVPSVRTIYIGFHVQKEPLDDVKVRKAINYAVDKEAIVEHILEGAGRPSDAPISPGIFGYDSQDKYEYNPEKAKELLAEAGYEDGLELEFYHPSGRYNMDETIAEAVQTQLAEVDIDVELINLEWTTYLEEIGQSVDKAPQDLYMLGWGCVTGDADYGLYSMFHSSQWRPDGPSRSYYANDKVDELLEEARVTSDDEEREELYAEAIEQIWDDAPWLFLHSESQINGYRTNVKGLVHHPLEYIDASQATIE